VIKTAALKSLRFFKMLTLIILSLSLHLRCFRAYRGKANLSVRRRILHLTHTGFCI
jgi:hypothetical protein